MRAPAIDLPAAVPSRPPARAGRVGNTIATALAPASWGTTYLVTSELLPSGHPMFAALARALPAGLLALVLTRRLPHGGWWWKSMVLGALNIGVFFSLLFVTAERLPGGVAATVGSVQPTIVALLAWTVLHERLSGWRLVGHRGGVRGQPRRARPGRGARRRRSGRRAGGRGRDGHRRDAQQEVGSTRRRRTDGVRRLAADRGRPVPRPHGGVVRRRARATSMRQRSAATSGSVWPEG
jgi:hypothetical protein